MIIPRTDTPSASDAGVSDFIDLILTEWYEASERTYFVNGLAAVDSRTKTLFSKNFVDCSPDQKSEIMVELGAKMLADAPPVGRHWASDAPSPPTNFYSGFRRLTLTAYYTSEAGATKELHFQVIPDPMRVLPHHRQPKGARSTVNDTNHLRRDRGRLRNHRRLGRQGADRERPQDARARSRPPDRPRAGLRRARAALGDAIPRHARRRRQRDDQPIQSTCYACDEWSASFS